MTISPWPCEPWTPDVRRLEAHRFGAELEAPPRAVVWAASGDDPELASALLVAQRCNRLGAQPHFIWHPDGEVIQMTPLTRACRQARSEGPAVGLLVVLVVTDAGRALEPGQRPSETPLGGVFAALDIPPDWPAGPPALGGPQVIPAKPGHYLSQQVRGFSENHQSARLGRA